MIRSRDTKSHMLGSKLHSGTSKTMQLVPIDLDLHWLVIYPADTVTQPFEPLGPDLYVKPLFLFVSPKIKENLCPWDKWTLSYFK